MSIYTVSGKAGSDAYETVSEDHFGVNLVTIYDEEFADPTSELAALVEKLGITNLRFPGGSATEHYFDMAQPNASISSFDPEQELLPMDLMFEQAGKSELSVSIVVPTKQAFSQSAAEAMLAGSYGGRQEIKEKYFNELREFIGMSISEAKKNGVPISAIEIGNEFWGAGQMTANEYGFLASQILPFIEKVINDLGEAVPALIIQGISAASEKYSPKDPIDLFINADEHPSSIKTKSEMVAEFGEEMPTGWVSVNVLGQGSAYDQISDLADNVNANQNAANLVSGIVGHYYIRGGFSDVDAGKEFFFSQLSRLENLLDRSEDLPQVSFHITEWNANAANAENNRGLQHSAMMVEMFYEQLTHGVDTSQIWPLTFDKSQGITLTDIEQRNLTIAGETFGLMRETLVGLTPIVDWSIDNRVDVHGFGDEDEYVFVISERSGFEQLDANFDFSGFLGEGNYFARVVNLSDGDSGGADHRAAPILEYVQSKITSDGLAEVDLDPWSLAFVEFTKIGNQSDMVVGSDRKDIMRGLSEGDYLDGKSAGDKIFGKGGNDTLFGGAGRDVLIGGKGSDVLSGGVGRDKMIGGKGRDTIDGGAWDDSIYGGTGQDSLTGGSGKDEIRGGAGKDIIYGGGWSDTLHGGASRDSIFGGSGRDYIEGGKGDDVASGGEWSDTVIGGAGDDQINGEQGADTLVDGKGEDTVSGGTGADHFVFSADHSKDFLNDFEFGLDALDVREWEIDSPNSIEIGSDLGNLHGEQNSWIRVGNELLIFEGASSTQVGDLVFSDLFIY